MREIRFRGIDTMTGQWRFGDLVHNMKVTLTGVEPRVMVGGYEVKPETVGQFTGFRDMEGTDIYEGDIVEYQGCWRGKNYPRYTVDYNSTIGTFVVNRGRLIDNLYPKDLCFNHCVVGNIHQNPELLDKNEEDSP